MNGIHDLGGMHGFGRVPVDDEAPFHGDWERRVYAINKLLRLQDTYGIDEFRHGVERIPPADYLEAGYFERWLDAVERLCVEKGVLDADELRARREAAAADDLDDRPRTDPGLAAAAREGFEADGFTRVEDGPGPRFAVGDRVAVVNRHGAGHTRAPRYARRARGTVRRHRGAFPVPDAAAHGGDDVEPLYSVRFDAAELWDGDTSAGSVHLDCWERYLEPADD
jgi:nitrile hydratase